MTYNKKPPVNSSEFMTIIGRAGAGVPIKKIEAIFEFSPDTNAEYIFNKALNEGKLIKTLVDTDKIRSLVILDDGQVHPSTFHFVTLKNRVVPYIPLLTTIGYDNGGINGNKINIMVDYRYEKAGAILDEFAKTKDVIPLYEDATKTKTLLMMDGGRVYPSTFNYPTLDKRYRELLEEQKDANN